MASASGQMLSCSHWPIRTVVSASPAVDFTAAVAANARARNTVMVSGMVGIAHPLAWLRIPIDDFAGPKPTLTDAASTPRESRRQNRPRTTAPGVKNVECLTGLDSERESFVPDPRPVDAILSSSLAVLGPFALRVGGCDVEALPRKAQAFITWLALHPGRKVTREAVADLLWTDSGPEQARHSVRQMLVVLRRTPFGDLLRSSTDALWIELGAITVDALALEAGLTATDETELSHHAALYRGPLLEGFPSVSAGFDEWLRLERARLAATMARLLRRLIAAETAAGDHDAATDHAARLVALDTLDEAGYRLLMECHARAGRRAEALQQFEICAGILREELDVAPEPETSALAERIRGGWPAVTVAATPVADAPADGATDRASRPVVTLPANRWHYGLALAALVVVAVAVIVLRPSGPPRRVSSSRSFATTVAFRPRPSRSPGLAIW